MKGGFFLIVIDVKVWIINFVRVLFVCHVLRNLKESKKNCLNLICFLELFDFVLTILGINL